MHLITLFRIMNPHQRCLQAKVKYRNEPKQVMPKNEYLSRSLEINAIWTFDTEFPTIFNNINIIYGKDPNFKKSNGDDSHSPAKSSRCLARFFLTSSCVKYVMNCGIVTGTLLELASGSYEAISSILDISTRNTVKNKYILSTDRSIHQSAVLN